jgi:SMC interacting uncharacterized protein involved in chromosome segregation
MKLAKVAVNILAEDNDAPHHERITELEKERGAVMIALGHSAEDYEIVVAGSRKLSSEHDQLKIRCDSLQAELAQAHSDTEKRISDLEAKVYPSKPAMLRLLPRVKRV